MKRVEVSAAMDVNFSLAGRQGIETRYPFRLRSPITAPDYCVRFRSMPRRRFTGLWRHPGFMNLWIGQTISVLGSLVGVTAIGFTAILVLHATPFQLGLLAAARLV